MSSTIRRQIDVRGKALTAVLDPDPEEGGYTITCVEIPAALSEGDSEQEAVDNLIDAIELCLDTEEDLKKAHPHGSYRQAL